MRLSRKQNWSQQRTIAMMATGGQAEHPLDGVRAYDLNVLQQEDEILAATRKAADGE